MFWIIVVVVVLVGLSLGRIAIGSDLGRIAISGLIIAGACLLIYKLTNLAIAVILAKICGVGVILIVAFSFIRALFDNSK